MPSIAPTNISGGGGFNFEDSVAAYYLMAMLSGRMPLGSAFQNIEKIDWQAADRHWELDDVVLSGAGGFEAGLSIKSKAHLKTTGFSRDFIERCWRQYRGETGRAFKANGDLLCLAVGNISSEVERAWQLLSSQLQRTSLERVEGRFNRSQQGSGEMSELQRTIIQSLIDFSPGATSPSVLDVLAMLRSVRVLRFDFLNETSELKDSLIQSLQFLADSGSRSDATALWEMLLSIARDHRTGGDITRDELIQQLRGRCQLRPLPNYSQDLDLWHRLSTDRLRHMKWQVSENLPPLERPSLWNELDVAMSYGKPVILIGNSGSGKTSLINEYAKRSDRRLYLLDSTLTSTGGMFYGNVMATTGHHLSELLKAETRPSVLMIDAAERMTSEQIDAICSVIHSIKIQTSDRQVDVVITCLPVVDDGLRAALSRDKLNYHSLPVLNPSADEVRECLGLDSRLAALTVNNKLIGLLTHLKVFELLLRALDSGVALHDVGFKQVELLNFLWEDWILRQSRELVRGKVLQGLSVKDADKLAPGEPLAGLESTDLAAVPSLLDDNLLARFEEKIFFSHDFVADLSRFRVLLASNVDEVAKRSENFQWHAAIKLLSQHLAESSAQRWLDTFGRLVSESPNRPVICDTLFVDGLINASKTDPTILRIVLPVLLAQHPKLATTLVDRTALVGTIPDDNWRHEISPKILSMAGPWRQCDGVAVATVLELFAADRDATLSVVSPLMTLCEMLLRRSFVVDDVPAQVLADVSELSFRVAEQVIFDDDMRHRYRNAIGSIYLNALFSAIVDPTRAADVGLRAARRKPLPAKTNEAEIDDEMVEVEEGVQLLSSSLLSSLIEDDDAEVEPWPNGPFERVSNTFREVVLESDALIPLIYSSPELAKEIFLACCIEEPQSRRYRHWDDSDSLCIVQRFTRRPPFYDVGPMLHFFKRAPDQALDILITLCNFGTERWYESESRIRQQEYVGTWMGRRLGPFEFDVPSSNQASDVWKGNCNIYRWSLGGLPTCKPITNCLMAFEYWITRETSAGHDVSQALQRVVREGRSAGLAGCLIDIGKRSPELFLGPLMPLLGCWVLYGWDRVKCIEDSGVQVGMIEWNLHETPQRRAKGIAWFKAEHRQWDLLEIARQFFIRHEGFREFMQGAQATWKSEDEELSEYHALEQLKKVFDWSNYQSHNQQGESQIIYAPPEEDVQRGQAELKRINEQQLLLTFPMSCSQLLEKKQLLSQEQIDWVWSSIKTIEELTEEQRDDELFPETGWSRKPDAYVAAAAVLVKLGSRLLKDEQVEYCRSTYLQFLDKPPARRPFDSPEAVGNWSWDFFFAELTVEYLVQDPTDEAARWGIERCISGYHYHQIEHFMRLACQGRTKLSGIFEQLPSYLISWSALNEHLRRLHSEKHRYEEYVERCEANSPHRPELEVTLTALRNELTPLYQTYNRYGETVATCSRLEVTLETQITDSIAYLQKVSEATGVRLYHPPRQRRNEEDLDNADVGLDLYVLEHGLAWIDLSVASDQAEFDRWSDLLLGLVRVQQSLIPPLKNHQQFRGYGYAHDFDMFVDRLLAQNIVRAWNKDLSNHWKLKLSQISICSEQVTEFLEFVPGAAVDGRPDPKGFVWNMGGDDRVCHDFARVVT